MHIFSFIIICNEVFQKSRSVQEGTQRLEIRYQSWWNNINNDSSADDILHI